MKVKVACLLASLSFALSTTAFAQSGDSKYCTALSNKYQTYAQDNGGRSHNTPSAAVASAMSKCSSDPASAIPVLEGALNSAKVSLPPR
jgi:hypothetical protein